MYSLIIFWKSNISNLEKLLKKWWTISYYGINYISLNVFINGLHHVLRMGNRLQRLRIGPCLYCIVLYSYISYTKRKTQ